VTSHGLSCSSRPPGRRRDALAPPRPVFCVAAATSATTDPRPLVRQPLELQRLINSIPYRKLCLWASVALFLWPLHEFFGVGGRGAFRRAAGRAGPAGKPRGADRVKLGHSPVRGDNHGNLPYPGSLGARARARDNSSRRGSVVSGGGSSSCCAGQRPRLSRGNSRGGRPLS
jgi:hypothetical protein